MHKENTFSAYPQIQLAFDFIQHTGSNVFLTGKAGTGKTTFLKQLQAQTHKRFIITAPTGIAAINAGGVTIHSFFQLPFGPQLLGKSENTEGSKRTTEIHKFSKDKIRLIRNLDLLVIDEISMVRADLLDAIDRVLRRYRKKHQPFGGVQLLMIGDIQQLAPVVKEEDWLLLKTVYATPYFFSSKSLAETHFVSIELQHIFRQKDANFIRVLNQIRENNLDAESLKLLNERVMPDFQPKSDEGYILLTTHIQQANRINEQMMSKLNTPSSFFNAEVSGDFPPYAYPNEERLELKLGSQVMFVRNDASREKRFYNGKIGVVLSIDDEVVTVSCPDGDLIETEAVEWHNYSYTMDPETEEIREELKGTFKQMPLKAAWAITIHKSQGLTFEKAIIDASAAFAHGQVYVALSRCRNLEGLVLRSSIDPNRVLMDKQIVDFMHEVESNPTNHSTLQLAKDAYQAHLIHELVDFISIRLRLDTLYKLYREMEAIYGEESMLLCRELVDSFRKDLMDVSRKFVREVDRLLIQNPNVQSNHVLQERVSKGCRYFQEKLLLLQSKVATLDFKSGNKAQNKSVKDAYAILDEDMSIKFKQIEYILNSYNASFK